MYRSEFPSVYRAAFLITGDRELARDATQEAFKRAYARWRRLPREPWVGGWIMTTALNLAKKRARDVPTGSLSEDQWGADTPSSDRVDVAEALRRLPPRQRQITVMHYIGDLPVEAIAELLDVREGTVKAHLAQARSALRDILEVKHV